MSIDLQIRSNIELSVYCSLDHNIVILTDCFSIHKVVIFALDSVRSDKKSTFCILTLAKIFVTTDDSVLREALFEDKNN